MSALQPVQGSRPATPLPSCLIVDDSRVIRSVIRKIMQQLSFDVVEAENGRVALERCASRMPDVILLDWNMPVMNGMDFLRAVRRLRAPQQPTVLVCTTQNDVAHIREALQSGANEYIMKPFDGEILRAKLLQVGLI